MWKASIGTGFSSISIADGRVCSMGNTDGTDHLACLDEQTGEELWRHSYPCALDDNLFEGGPTSTPTIDGDSVYTFGRRGELFCLDVTNGDVRWSVNVREDADAPMPTWGFGSSVLVQGDIVVLNAGGAGLALNKSTGEIVWSSGNHEAAYASPVNFSPGVVLFLSGRELTAVKVRSGEPVWSYRWLTRLGVNAADPIVAGDRVFLSSGYGKGAALLDVGSETPEEVWRSRDLKTQFSTAILHDGYLYGIDGDTTDVARLRCLELETGDVQWTHEEVGSGSVLLAADRLLVLTDEGDLLVAPVSPDQFTPVATAHVLDGKCWTSPALANGRLYCRNAAGDLLCLEVR
jgi:outer membrane protein assembly factor BamB